MKPGHVPATPLVFERGESVEVFYRFSHDKQGYFPVESMTQGMLHPCITRTDGWIPAIVENRFDLSALAASRINEAGGWDVGGGVNVYDGRGHDQAAVAGEGSKGKGKGKDGGKDDSGSKWDHLHPTVKVKYTSPFWYNRQGQHWQESKFRKGSVEPYLVRKIRRTDEPPHPRPKVSFFVLRWGGKRKVEPVSDGIGGWGQVGRLLWECFGNNLGGAVVGVVIYILYK